MELNYRDVKIMFVVVFYLPGSVENMPAIRNYREIISLSHADFFNAVIDSVFAKSTLNCAVVCNGVSECHGFKFCNTSMTCHARHEVKGITSGNETAGFTSYARIGKPRCPDDFVWNVQLDFCYKVHGTTYNNWYDAKHTCEEETEGGRWVILDSRAKHQTLVDYIMGNEPFTNYFVGGHRYSLDDELRWTDGQSIDKSLWCPGQPNEARCGNLWAMGLWTDDVYCDIRQQLFICEKPLSDVLITS